MPGGGAGDGTVLDAAELAGDALLALVDRGMIAVRAAQHRDAFGNREPADSAQRVIRERQHRQGPADSAGAAFLELGEIGEDVVLIARPAVAFEQCAKHAP